MLISSEAKTQADVTPAEQPKIVKPAEMLFCIQHGQMVKAELGVCGLGHVVMEGEGDDQTLDFCCFPDGYTFVTQPEESDFLEEPSDPDDALRLETEREQAGIEEWLRMED